MTGLGNETTSAPAPPAGHGPVDRPVVRQEPERIADGMPASADERRLRRVLAARVAMPYSYFDDGEAQGHEHGIAIDFMREPVADIDAKLLELNVARAHAQIQAAFDDSDDDFMAGVLCALDVVYLHDPDPGSVLATEIVDACGRNLLEFAKRDHYHNLDLLRRTVRAAEKL